MTGIGNTAVIPVNPMAASAGGDRQRPAEDVPELLGKMFKRRNQIQSATKLQANSSGVKFLRAGDGAGQTLTINQRNCQDYPLELSFIHQGITFYQLKSAAAVAALG